MQAATDCSGGARQYARDSDCDRISQPFADLEWISTGKGIDLLGIGAWLVADQLGDFRKTERLEGDGFELACPVPCLQDVASPGWIRSLVCGKPGATGRRWG